MDRFFTALPGGRLLPPTQLAEMRWTVPTAMRQPLTCGGHTWGHGGDLEGFTVRTGFTADGGRSVVVANGTGGDERAVRGLVDRAL
ncbi:hypothetical protein ACFS5L_15985 [Streptomyces phyllanthi]|uniref:hypothetical protein n=1 Tax=Streptomyces phyllanthi TaxID=1803180 RepID=UPI00363DF7BA